MTENQFELLIIYGGMMQEGMAGEEAISALEIMQYDPEDIEWLENRIQFQLKKVKMLKKLKKLKKSEKRLWIEQQEDPSHNQW